MTGFQSFDLSLLLQIYNAAHNATLDKIMPVISTAGNLGTIWIILSLILLCMRKYRKAGVLCLAALILTAIAGEGIIKNIVQRPRPFNEIAGVQLLISRPESWSFPSGHTASSFAAFWILFREVKKFALPGFVLAVLIAFSRMYLLVHYPSDIAAGMMLGILGAELARMLFYKINLKRGQVR